MARRIAHEVKNPLTPIQLSAQRLKKRYGKILDGEDAEIFDECTGMIITQVEELKRLVNEFSNFARMPAANPAPSDINDIINQALSLYRETHKEVDFVFNDSKEVPVFDLDREQIRRVMINLFDNAIEACSELTTGNARITFEVKQNPKYIIMEILDNGIGMSPEAKDKAFTPFFSTKGHAGTGLGLFITHKTIEQHGGTIAIIDASSEQGTHFRIQLPKTLSESTKNNHVTLSLDKD